MIGRGALGIVSPPKQIRSSCDDPAVLFCEQLDARLLVRGDDVVMFMTYTSC